jgi:hypothetical protein
MSSSTVSNLKAAKVGDEVVYYGTRENDPGKVSRVVRVTISQNHPEAAGVWLEDKTRWTGEGKKWGDGRAFGRDRAHLILDREAFYKNREAAEKRLEMIRMREALISYAIPREYAFRYLDDMEVKTIWVFLAKAKERQAADIFIRFAASLSRG